MKENLSMLYSYKGIKKYFKEALYLDILDYHTIESFVRNKMTNISIQELEIMLDTMEDNIKNGNSVQSFTISIYNTVIMILTLFITGFMAIYGVIIAFLISKGHIGTISDMKGLVYALFFVAFTYLIHIAIYFSRNFHRNINQLRLKELIVITLAIKKKLEGEKDK